MDITNKTLYTLKNISFDELEVLALALEIDKFETHPEFAEIAKTLLGVIDKGLSR